MPNLVVSLNIDLVVEVPGLADLFRHLHKIGQRTRNRSRSLVCDENSQRQRDQSAQRGDHDDLRPGIVIRLAPLLHQVLGFLVRLVQVVG